MINETYLVNCCNVGKLSTEYLWCIRGLVFSMQHISPPFGPFSDARDNVGCTIPVLELPVQRSKMLHCMCRVPLSIN
jgi:hypothetical protein